MSMNLRCWRCSRCARLSIRWPEAMICLRGYYLLFSPHFLGDVALDKMCMTIMEGYTYFRRQQRLVFRRNNACEQPSAEMDRSLRRDAFICRVRRA